MVRGKPLNLLRLLGRAPMWRDPIDCFRLLGTRAPMVRGPY